MVFLGSWLSGFVIIATDAWMQHPVAYSRLPDGSFEASSFSGLLLNPWALLQYAHNMSGVAITGSFVMVSIGAFYLLNHRYVEYGCIFLRVGCIAGFLFTTIQIFPTGDLHGKRHPQPAWRDCGKRSAALRSPFLASPMKRAAHR